MYGTRHCSIACVEMLQRTDVECRNSNIRLDEYKTEVQQALFSMQKKLYEATVDRSRLEESKRRSDAALIAAQHELKETQTKLSLMEHRCKLLEDIDNRVI